MEQITKYPNKNYYLIASYILLSLFTSLPSVLPLVAFIAGIPVTSPEMYSPYLVPTSIALTLLFLVLAIVENANKRPVYVEDDRLVWKKSKRKTIILSRIEEIRLGLYRITVLDDGGNKITINKSHTVFTERGSPVSYEMRGLFMSMYLLYRRDSQPGMKDLPINIPNSFWELLIVIFFFYAGGIFFLTLFFLLHHVFSIIMCLGLFLTASLLFYHRYKLPKCYRINEDSIEIFYRNKNRNRTFGFDELQHEVEFFMINGDLKLVLTPKYKPLGIKGDENYVIFQRYCSFSLFKLSQFMFRR
ncbi:MAG: hypothetical protein JW969_14970 [Spirochaetales bacterium]|nr:hypothetical protein [Spirochaetales bacterium]